MPCALARISCSTRPIRSRRSRRSRRRWRTGSSRASRSMRRSAACFVPRRAWACTARVAVNIESVPLSVGGRQHQAVARTISERSLTLIKDEGSRVPLRLPPRCERALPVGARLPVGLAHRRPQPDDHSRAEAALGRDRGGRGVGSLDAERAGPGARHGLEVRRADRRRLRPGLVGERAPRPGALRDTAAPGSGPRRVEAWTAHGCVCSSAVPMWRRACPRCRRCS